MIGENHMGIAPLSMLESQTNLQERADRVEMKIATVKENDKQFIKKIRNDAIEKLA